MKKFIGVLCLSLLASYSAYGEEFAEFKGRSLSHEAQQQIADNLMDWATTHHVNAEKRWCQKSIPQSKTMAEWITTWLMNTCGRENLKGICQKCLVVH